MSGGSHQNLWCSQTIGDLRRRMSGLEAMVVDLYRLWESTGYSCAYDDTFAILELMRSDHPFPEVLELMNDDLIEIWKEMEMFASGDGGDYLYACVQRYEELRV